MAELFFTSDTHSYVFPTDYISDEKRNMGYIAAASQFADGAIIADGGDVLQGSPLIRYELEKGIRPFTAAEAFNRAGLSIYTPGNHDFNFGYDTLRDFLTSLEADTVAANLIDERGELDVRRFVIKDTSDGLRLLFVGVITDYVNIWEKKENLEGLKIIDSVRAAKEALEEGRRFSPDFTICIYHGGFDDNETGEIKENRGMELAELGFDVLLTAHQHAIIEPKRIGTAITLQTGAKAMHYARLLFNHDKSIEAEVLATDSSLPMKKCFQTMDDNVEKQVIQSLKEPIGRIRGVLQDSSKLESAVHGSSLADFFGDIQPCGLLRGYPAWILGCRCICCIAFQ